MLVPANPFEHTVEDIRLVRQWIRDRVRDAGPLTKVPRLDGWPAPDEFREQYARRSRPFIARVRDEASFGLKGLSLRDLAGFGQGTRFLLRDADYRTAIETRRTVGDTSLPEYVELLESSEGGATESLPYLANQPAPDDLLARAGFPEEYFGSPVFARMWLGPDRAVTHLHCDYPDNLVLTALGRKSVLLYPPDQADLLYPQEVTAWVLGALSAPRVLLAGVDPDAPDYAKHPHFRAATALREVLEPGDVLYIPSSWFHHFRCIGTSMTLTCFAAAALPAAIDQAS